MRQVGAANSGTRPHPELHSAPLTSTAEILGPGGPLSRALSAYESRSGQLEMAAAVERTLASDRILFCEAGTGTGKTLAYLVPALLSVRR